MCGLAGIFLGDGRQPINAPLLQAMAAAQAHRGPDGSGVFEGLGVGLAHRRLAIIDPHHSQQPMTSQDGQLTLIFNGAIYNFADLRRSLQEFGHRFETQGDSEVLLHGFRHWGEGLFARLNGMFALALYDRAADRLILARDRMGQKPLHLLQTPSGDWYFASEINALKCIPNIPWTVNSEAIEDYFAFGYVPDDHAIFTQVQKLAAGHFLILHRGDAARPQCYWDADFRQRLIISEGDAATELRETLDRAVARHCVADVPIGSFLSGGLDSSTITALLAQQLTKPAVAQSISFVGGAEEGRDAAAYAAMLSIPQQTHYVAPPDLAALHGLVALFGEPFADSSALAMVPLAASARAHMRVALTGDGADEVFAGYRRHRFHMLEERVRAHLPESVRRPVFGAVASVYPKADWAPQWLRARATFAALSKDSASAYAQAVSMLAPCHRQRLFSEQFQTNLRGYRAEDRYRTVMATAPARTMLDCIQYADLKLSLPGGILTKVDRTSMAAGIEARSPFLDNDLVDFALQLPAHLRLRRGQGKWVLKAATAGLLPDQVRRRPKQGFVPPLAIWFRGPLAEMARHLPQARCVTETGWFQPDWIAQIVRQHQSGRADWGRLIWQLLIFSLWFDQHLGQDSGPR